MTDDKPEVERDEDNTDVDANPKLIDLSSDAKKAAKDADQDASKDAEATADTADDDGDAGSDGGAPHLPGVRQGDDGGQRVGRLKRHGVHVQGLVAHPGASW